MILKNNIEYKCLSVALPSFEIFNAIQFITLTNYNSICIRLNIFTSILEDIFLTELLYIFIKFLKDKVELPFTSKFLFKQADQNNLIKIGEI